jgi:hypothetical protein
MCPPLTPKLHRSFLPSYFTIQQTGNLNSSDTPGRASFNFIPRYYVGITTEACLEFGGPPRKVAILHTFVTQYCTQKVILS